VQDNPKFASPRVLSFTAHDLPIDLPKIGAFRAPGERDRELTLPRISPMVQNLLSYEAVRKDLKLSPEEEAGIDAAIARLPRSTRLAHRSASKGRHVRPSTG